MYINKVRPPFSNDLCNLVKDHKFVLNIKTKLCSQGVLFIQWIFVSPPLRWMVGTCCLWIMIVRCELKRFMMTTESSYWRSSMIPKAIRHSGFPAASCCQLTWHTPGKPFLLGGKTSLFLGFISGTLDRQRIRISQWMWQATMTGQSRTLHGRKVMWTDMNTRNTGFPA